MTTFLTRPAYDALLPFTASVAAAFRRAKTTWTLTGVTIKFRSEADAKAFGSTCGLSLPMHVAHGKVDCGRSDCPHNRVRRDYVAACQRDGERATIARLDARANRVR